MARRYLVIGAIIGVLALPFASPLVNLQRTHLGSANPILASQGLRHQSRVHSSPWIHSAAAPLPSARAASGETPRSGHPGRGGERLGGLGKWFTDRLSDAKQLWGRVFQRTNEDSHDELVAGPPVGGDGGFSLSNHENPVNNGPAPGASAGAPPAGGGSGPGGTPSAIGVSDPHSSSTPAPVGSDAAGSGTPAPAGGHSSGSGTGAGTGSGATAGTGVSSIGLGAGAVAAGKSLLKSGMVYPEVPLSNTLMASRYDIVIVQDNAVTPGGWDPQANTEIGDPQRIQKLKAVNPNVKVLLYVFPQISWGWDDDFREEWAVHGADGRRVKNPDDPNNQILMNINNADYRRFIIQRIMDTVNQYGFDGVFNDGIWPTVNLGQGVVGWTPTPPQEALDNWHAWSLQLMRELKQALGSRLLITSTTPVFDDGNPKDRDDDFLAVVDGTALEGYLHAPWDPPTMDNRDWWPWQQSMVKRNSAAGKYFLGVSGTSDPWTADQLRQWQLFTLASYLLQADTRWTYYQWQYYAYFPEMDAPIGTPLGDAYSSGDVWQRDFTNGKVIVNVSTSTNTVSLQEPYRTLQGRDTVTLRPSTAVVLLGR